MAATATVYPEMEQNQRRGNGASGQARSQHRRPAYTSVPGGARQKLPCFPNDDLFFEAKGIDNSMVVRADDAAGGRQCWRAMGSVVAVALIFTGLMLPSAYRMMAGRQMHQLSNEQSQLRREIAELLALEARQTNLKRLEVLARQQNLIDPPAQLVQHITSKGAYALNSLPSGK